MTSDIVEISGQHLPVCPGYHQWKDSIGLRYWLDPSVEEPLFLNTTKTTPQLRVKTFLRTKLIFKFNLILAFPSLLSHPMVQKCTQSKAETLPATEESSGCSLLWFFGFSPYRTTSGHKVWPSLSLFQQQRWDPPDQRSTPASPGGAWGPECWKQRGGWWDSVGSAVHVGARSMDARSLARLRQKAPTHLAVRRPQIPQSTCFI